MVENRILRNVISKSRLKNGEYFLGILVSIQKSKLPAIIQIKLGRFIWMGKKAEYGPQILLTFNLLFQVSSIWKHVQLPTQDSQIRL